MARAPVTQRGVAVVIFSLLTGLGTLIAALVGGVLGQVMTGTLLSVGPLLIKDLAILFVGTMLGRIVMVGAFWRTLADNE